MPCWKQRPVGMAASSLELEDVLVVCHADREEALNKLDVAIAFADVILASSDPRSALSVIEFSKATYRKMKQNLWWAAGYDLISVPLAAGVLAPIADPAAGAAAAPLGYIDDKGNYLARTSTTRRTT